MQVLYWLEGLRFPVLNQIMLAVTRLGEETAFLALALVFFWCIDKKRGYYLMAVGFAGTIANQFVKLLCRVPRPWVLDESFTILEEAREAASGYSFPSGHTQMAVGTFGSIAASDKKRWIKTVCIIFMVLVPFSRMYVGVHTPSDVLVGAGMALLLVWLMKKPTLEGGDRSMKVLIAVITAMALGLLLYVERYPFPADVDEVNLQSGLKNAYTMLGCMIGVGIVYAVDKRLDFSVDAVWWAQILKAALGLVLVVTVKSVLKAPLQAVMPEYPARAVRYCLVVIVAGIVWPLTFKWFSKLGRK